MESSNNGDGINENSDNDEDSDDEKDSDDEEDSDDEDSDDEDSDDDEKSDDEDSDDEEDSEDEDKIKKQFLDADKMVKTLPGVIQKHPDHMYTSKIIYTQRISKAIKEASTSKPIDSVEVPTD
ncbi:hypothetical protein F8M41_013770 [Gigaspora margarita]|uniref:Uncharacterized protein n=1 Tax=Gigaspora margarita TaxID=4874 RepID=A0A8H4EV36_GIGMA|nr:hypothetical protein F8M41_013770 [Gigaspora margarita]